MGCQDWQRKLNTACSGGRLADLRGKIMVIDGIKVTTQPVFSWQLILPPQKKKNFYPPGIAGAEDAREQTARSDNQHVPSLLCGAGAARCGGAGRDYRPGFQKCITNRQVAKENPVGKLRTRHSGSSSHLLWTGRRKSVACVGGSGRAASPGWAGQCESGQSLHTCTRAHASRMMAPMMGGRLCRRQMRLPLPRVLSCPALPFVP